MQYVFWCIVLWSVGWSDAQKPASASASASICVTSETCSACIQQPGCVWCAQTEDNDTIATRCLHEKDITKDWCPNKIISFENLLQVLQNDMIQTAKDKTAVQISPQKIKLRLLRGVPYTLKFKYGQAADYPVDLYYLMDLSGSMKQHKEALSKLGVILAETMRNLTSKFRVGFGSFVDKVVLPYVDTHPKRLKQPCTLDSVPCAPPYGYRNHLPLTEDTTRFSYEVGKANISGNLDAPEGGLDALMQAMVCAEEIGWRPKARHLLVLSTDAGYHIAGDGKLGGIVEPNDGQCHMSNQEYTHGLKLDYPSIGLINQKAIENNINVIFAIEGPTTLVRYYTDLKNRIKGASTGSLSKDSNIVQLIENNYNKIVDSIQIFDDFENIFSVQYHTSCNGEANENTNECRSLRIGSVVEFSVTIELLECPSTNLTRTYEIRPGALSETLIVEIEMVCECPCEKPDGHGFTARSPHCNSGNLTCGVCQCPLGKYGKKCDCDGLSGDEEEDTSSCRASPDEEMCSGQGVCKCGECVCDTRSNPTEKIWGRFCQCNNYTCSMRSGRLCSDHGKCNCGTCECHAGWAGKACDCRNNTEPCVSPYSATGDICSGNGECVCGQCQCSSTDDRLLVGKYCEELTTQCDKYHDCVQCRVFNNGKYDPLQCERNCIQISDIQLVDNIASNKTKDGNICTFLIGECNSRFTLTSNEANEIKIVAQKTLDCSQKDNVFGIVASVMGSIVLAGLITLISWKAVTTVHDRREYEKFEKERTMSKWHKAENPLFKNPTCQYNNPAYNTAGNVQL